FSSRRRHTRLQGDWSSDVCSSDLPPHKPLTETRPRRPDGAMTLGNQVMEKMRDDSGGRWTTRNFRVCHDAPEFTDRGDTDSPPRSEERRVGKECRTRWWT